MDEHFGDVLKEYVSQAGQTSGRLAQLVDLPKQTIFSWLDGRVKRPRNGQDILQLAVALRLTEMETDRLLKAAGHPPLVEWIAHSEMNHDPDLDALLSFWLDQRRSAIASQTGEWQVPFQAPPILRHFVGRQPLIKAVTAELLTGQICVLQGMAGSGKTALATHLAHTLREQFPDGVLWADLTGVMVNGRLQSTIMYAILNTFAAAYGRQLNDSYDLDSCSRVVRSILSNKKTLVVLDNAHHIDSVQPLLPSKGATATLVTTHNHLLLADQAQHFDMGAFSQTESRELLATFIGEERVRSQANGVQRILELLGQHPLAVKIAASQLAELDSVTLLEYDEMLREERSLLAGLGGWGGATENVRASLAVSYNRLSDEQQKLFQHLSLFNGADFAETAVAALTQTSKLKAVQSLGRLYALSLVDKSQTAPTPRYRLHPLLQAFAQEKLADSGEDVAQWQQRITSYYADFTQQNRHHYGLLTADWENITAALQWHLAQQDWQQLYPMVAALTDIYLGTVGFLDARGYWQDAQSYLVALLDNQVKAVDAYQQANLYLKFGAFAVRRAELPLAQRYLRDCLTFLADLPCTEEVCLHQAYAYDFLGEIAFWQHDIREALNQLEKGVAVLQAITSVATKQTEGYLRIRRASALGRSGQYEAAAQEARWGLSLLPPQPTSARVSSLMILGNVYDRLGRFEEAMAHYDEGRKLAEVLGDNRRLAGLWRNMGAVLTKNGRIQEAIVPKQKALALYEQIGDVEGSASLYSNLAEDYILLQDYKEAERHLALALAQARQHELIEAELFALVNMARWYLDMNELTAVQIILENVMPRSQQYERVQNSLEVTRLQAELDYRYGRYEPALTQVEAVLDSASPQEAGLLYRLRGDILRASGQVTKARKAYRESWRLLSDLNQFEAARSQAALAHLNEQLESIDKPAELEILLPEQYVRGELLAAGGQSIVYKGQHTETGKAIVIKCLKPELVQLEPEMAVRFMHEAAILHHLQHPNIVTILNAGKMGDSYVTILPYLPRSLCALLDHEAPLPLPQFLAIVQPIAAALAYCHEQGVLHRDLKPENILLAADGTPYLTDFGVARNIYRQTRLTSATAVIGTPDYIAPEIYQGQEPDEGSDIWSLGIVLYEMLMGERPFTRKTLAETIRAIIDAPLPQLPSTLPAPLVALVEQMLVKNPNGRTRQMQPILDQLIALQNLT